VPLISLPFAVFFAAVFAGHWLLPSRARLFWLVLASYVFYASWDWRWAVLLFGLTAASFLLGRGAASAGPWRRRLSVAAAVVLHAGVLAAFKIAARSADSIDVLREEHLGSVILPLGLSYYTFQCLGYVLDVGRGAAPATGFLPYALFAGFFVQLTAGPIGRAKVLLPQLQRDRPFDRARFAEGLHLLFWGLFQKVFVAENLVPVVVTVFDANASDSGLSALVGIYAFTLQLYGDFAGYSNIARGMGKLLGIDLAENFKLPFFAKDTQEHWKRWHVSLSEWFADFVYKPIIDLPVGYFKFFLAPVLTLLVMGLWHRLSLQMALLGLNYGAWIALTIYVKLKLAERDWEPSPRLAPVLPWINRLLTIQIVCFSFVLLRSPSLARAGEVARRALTFPAPTPQALDLLGRLALFAAPLALAEAVEFRLGGAGSLGRLPAKARAVLYAVLAVLLWRWGRFSPEAFYYSKF
jgi:D-alanyl-lipoteichoic acid acyltransferase DltB (MBOAT superfamily)